MPTSLRRHMTTAYLTSNVLPSSATTEPVRAELASVEVLHALYGERIFRFLLVSLRDHDVAQTLTQETFLKAWLARENFRGECSAITWLTRIALNLVRDHTRTNRFKFWRRVGSTAVDAQEMAGHLAHPGSSAAAALEAREQLELVWETVGTLSERQRTVFVLRFVEELGLNEIAEITGLPISTVKTHLYRALAAVRAKHAATAKETQ